MAADAPLVQIQHVSKRFGPIAVAKDITLEVGTGEVVVFLGPSGGGKTTLLRMIAGLEQPDEGTITIAGKDVQRTSARERQIGFVFQNYALFPHMTVFDNVAYGLRARNLPPTEIRRRVGEILALVQLTGLEDRMPRQLSGGQQQRVSLARALVIQPLLLIMDEPFSALDAQLRRQMQMEFRRIQHATGVTTLMVTHDQEEALTIADRVAVMRGGKIEQVGSPQEVYERPRNAFVATFLGEANVLNGIATADGIRLPGGVTLDVRVGAPVDTPVQLAVRPERVHLLPPSSDEHDSGTLPGTVEQVVYHGGHITYTVRVGEGMSFNVRVPSALLSVDSTRRRYAAGDPVRVVIPQTSVCMLES